MLEALEYYQSLAQKFPGRLLTAPGILVVLTGLCIWLAGLRWRRVIGAIAGAAIGTVAVFVVGNFAVGTVLIVCVVGLLAGVIVNRIVFGIFGAAVGALVVIAVLAEGSMAGGNSNYPTWPEYEVSDAGLDAPVALEISAKMAKFFIDGAKETVVSAGVSGCVGAGIAAVIVVIAALTAPRTLIAVVSSSLGAAVIFMGMIMLLFHKGSKPISYIAQRPQFYAAAFVAMVVFGTVVQLILSPAAKAKAPADEEKGENI